MKKILVVSNYRGYHTARPEAEIFIGLAKKGFDITIMTYPNAEYIKNFENAGIRVIGHHPKSKNDKEFITLLRKELTQGKYDILQLYNNKAIRNGIKAAKKIDIKIVIYRGASANMHWWNILNYFKFYHPRIDYVICNSEEIKNIFLKTASIHSIKPVTILKGHKLDWYSNIKQHDIRSEIGLNHDSLLLVTVANNRKVKGIDVLLRSMRHLPKDINIDLLIIGEKMDKSPIPSLINESGRKERIHLLGFRKDALNIVASCDIFVCPSIGSEALTKSVVEAMSLGVVPIISDIEGNRPLVNNMINGFVFKSANPKFLASTITIAYNSRQALPDFSKAAKLKINRDINSEQTVDQYSNFYLSI